jgi:hypothetical protein
MSDWNTAEAAVVSRALQTVAKELDDRLEKLVGRRVAFSLFVWTRGRSNYISTADRSEVIAVLEQHINGWKAGMPDVQAHRID